MRGQFTTIKSEIMDNSGVKFCLGYTTCMYNCNFRELEISGEQRLLPWKKISRWLQSDRGYDIIKIVRLTWDEITGVGEKINELTKPIPKPLKNAAEKPIIPVKHVIVINGTSNEITQITNEMEILTKIIITWAVDRLYKSPLISTDIKERMGVHGEQAHDYIPDSKGIPSNQQARELTDE